ncbi:MAG: nucleotidyltransferase domain-containing protein [Anaerolineales bacterium]
MDPRLDTREITPDLLAYIVQKIVDAINPQKIILFGSRARGDATPESDLDLFIVYDGTENSRIIRRKLDLLFWGRAFGMDILVNSSQELAENLKIGNLFVQTHIFAQGKILYERR